MPVFVCPKFLRPFVALLAIMVAAMPAIADSTDMSGAHEMNTYRTGHPSVRTNARSPDACASHCSGTAGCHAWSFHERVCELKPAMGVMAPSVGTKSGLYFPGFGHIALRDVDGETGLDVLSASIPLRRREATRELQQAAAQPVASPTPERAPVVQAPQDPFAPRQVSGWSFSGSTSAPATSHAPNNFESFDDFDDGLPDGITEEDGILYIDEDYEEEEDFYTLRP